MKRRPSQNTKYLAKQNQVLKNELEKKPIFLYLFIGLMIFLLIATYASFFMRS